LNKIESVGLRKCPYYCYLIEKVTSTDVRTTNISQRLPHKMAENDMKKLRHCHPMYIYSDNLKVLSPHVSCRMSGHFAFILQSWQQ